jgi:hypothetical protein
MSSLILFYDVRRQATSRQNLILFSLRPAENQAAPIGRDKILKTRGRQCKLSDNPGKTVVL